VSDRAYLSAAQLAQCTPWTEDAIRRMVSRGILRRGVHVFQPLGPRSQLVFRWEAIVELIEGRAAPARPPEEEGPDVEGATEALRGLVTRREEGNTATPLAHAGRHAKIVRHRSPGHAAPS
jgi:hypothetical protein